MRTCKNPRSIAIAAEVRKNLTPSSDSRKSFLGILFLAAGATVHDHDFDLKNPLTKYCSASVLDIACRDGNWPGRKKNERLEVYSSKKST